MKDNIGAFIIRIGFWGPFYYNYHKEPPKIALVILQAPKLHPIIPLIVTLVALKEP